MKRRAVAILQPMIAPPPPTGIARLNALCMLKSPDMYVPGPRSCRRNILGDDSYSDDDDVKDSQQMNPLSLAVTLYNSLC